MTTPTIEQLQTAYKRLTDLNAFLMQFFSETEKVEKPKWRRQDRESLQKIREAADYNKAHTEDEPLISIIIPTYNRSKIVVERTIPSILRQTYKNWEVIIVGDQMADPHVEILSGIDHPRIRFINLKRRGRYPSGKAPLWYVAGIKPMNFGLRIAKGRWIAHLDDDDEYLPEHLERLLHKARSENIEWAHAKVRFLDDDGVTEVAIVGEPIPRVGGISRISSLYHAGLKTFRYNPSCWKYCNPGDWDLWDRFLTMGVRHAHLPLVTAIHHGTIDQVANHLPDDTPPVNPLDQGIADYQQEKHQEAIDNLTRAITDDPQCLLGYAYLAFICARQGLQEEAESFITLACEIDPARNDLLAALGETYLKAGNPAEAQKYLEAALQKEPDMFVAYPAMAEALRQNGETERAIQLLSSAAGISSNAQENIQTGLIEILTQRGDIDTLAETCVRARSNQMLHSLAIRLLTRAGSSAERIGEELAWHAEKFLPRPPSPSLPRRNGDHGCLGIAFLVSDFAREARLGRLESLLLHLPTDTFRTIVIDNDAAPKPEEVTQRCSLLSDQWVVIHREDDQTAGEIIAGQQIDILIDFDGHGPRQRLGVFSSSRAPFKATWSDMPPSGTPEAAWIRGEMLLGQEETASENESLIVLPGLGEIYRLPDLPTTQAVAPTTFGCLTSAILIGADTWRFYAQLLLALPDARLRINLDNLGAPAQEFISDIFSQAGVIPERLEFVHATTVEELCEEWHSIAVGLAPLHGSGDMALPACLWMDTPYVALRSAAPWSQRPAAILEAVDLPELVAPSLDEYITIAGKLVTAWPKTALRKRLEATAPDRPAQFAERFAAAISIAYAKGCQ
jgi:predicted O-linked N-acetylglucosamine transferase (SPINDLY family)